MSIAKAIVNHLIRLVVDVDGVNTEIERQANAWILSDEDGTLNP
jgi:hypothetical protein